MSAAQPIEVFCTELALTKGVKMVSGFVHEGARPAKHPAFRLAKPVLKNLIFHPHWHVTHEMARQRVLAMVASRRRSLEKERMKLNEIEAKLNAGELPMVKEEE